MTPLRLTNPKEPLAGLVAYQATCRHCQGQAVIARDPQTWQLDPNNIHCLRCGQRYYITVNNMDFWERKQGRQKQERLQKTKTLFAA